MDHDSQAAHGGVEIVTDWNSGISMRVERMDHSCVAA